MGKKIAILGYGPSETKIHEKLSSMNYQVDWIQGDLEHKNLKRDLMISFGYRKLIPREFLDLQSTPVINLHMSLLPKNRGAHPLFWALLNSEPVGVTIHELDEGLDTGDILFQRQISLDTSMTFRQAHKLARESLEELLLENIDSLFEIDSYKTKQSGSGSFHKKSDLPAGFLGWDSIIEEAVNDLRNQN